MATTEDLQTIIKAADNGDSVFVDKFDDGVLWLSLQVRGGGAHVCIERDEALKMLEAIKRVLEVE